VTAPSLDRSVLLADLQKQVLALEEDLREQVGRLPDVEAKLRKEHADATKAKRTAATWNTFLGEQVTQSAVAWVLGTVFVRWCEDNRLIDPMLSGPGDWTPVCGPPAMRVLVDVDLATGSGTPRGKPVQGAVWPVGVVLDAPVFCQYLGLQQGVELFRGKEFVPEPAVERLAVAVLPP
jgi:hypothetical protein